MTKRRVRRRKPAKVVEPEIEEEVLDEEDFEDELDDEDEPEEKPAPKRRRKRRAATSAHIEEEDEPEEKPAPKRRRRKVATKEMDVEEETTLVGQAKIEDLGQTLCDLVEAGQVIVLRKVGRFVAFHKAGTVGAVTRSGKGSATALSRRQFEEIAYSPEFQEFHPEWSSYTYEEKIELAEDEKVTWERHENPKVDVMRLTTAVRKSRGIDKWCPEYGTRSARDALLRQGIRADPID